MEPDERRSQTKNDLILRVWERMDRDSVGAAELTDIQVAIEEKLGPAAVDSPASIARILADHGAELRHAEVLDLDTEWRDKRLERFNGLDFSSLSEAVAALSELVSLRSRFEKSGDKAEIARLVEFVDQVRDELALMALSKKQDDGQAQAKEICEWLVIWRNSPDLFPDWLELRLASPGFRSLFPDFQSGTKR